MTKAGTVSKRLEAIFQDLRDLHPWLDVDRRNGTGALGVVAFNSPVRYREPVVRDYVSFLVPGWVSVYGAHAIVYRCTGTPVSAVIDGRISMNGAAAKPDRRSHGPGAPAARILEGANGFLVACSVACGRVHMTAERTSLAAWSPFVWGFGGEVFMCPDCGEERELRLD